MSRTGVTPAVREIALFKDADRKKADEIEKEAAKIDQERLKKQQQYIEETFQKELAKLAEELHEPIKTARNTPAPKRTPGATEIAAWPIRASTSARVRCIFTTARRPRI